MIMESILILVLLSASGFMCVAIGASSIAAVFGPVASGGKIGVMRSALLAGIAAMLGAVFQGRKVTETIGIGILEEGLGVGHALIVLLIAASLVIASTLTDHPMPTAFTVVGSIIGVGLGSGIIVRWSTVNMMLLYWLLIPILGFLLGYILYIPVKGITPSNENDDGLRHIVLVGGLLMAFMAGANSVGRAIGPLMALDIDIVYLLIFGGVGIMMGCWFLSPRVINAISFDYSSIGPRRSISALATAILLTQVGNSIGVPVAFVQVIITAIIGSGMAAGTTNISRKKTVMTALGWLSAFILAVSIAFVIGSLMTNYSS